MEKTCLRSLARLHNQAARKHSVHVVYTFKIINGPNGDQETPSKYMQPDGLHFNEKGHELIASLHREVGYQYSGL